MNSKANGRGPEKHYTSRTTLRTHKRRPVEAHLLTLAAALSLSGCGLGYVDVVPEESVSVRIENGTVDQAEVTITVGAASTSTEGSAAGSDAAKVPGDAVIHVPSGDVSNGELLCGEMITVTAVVGDAAASEGVRFSGDGAGTAGFDSGSVGSNGERFLFKGDDYECGDTVLIRLSSTSTGEILVLAEGAALPDPIVPPDSTDPTGSTSTDAQMVALRLENATAGTIDITITPQSDPSADEPEPGVSVRVAGGQFSSGEIVCGQTYGVAATVGTATVLFSGDGTGTIGFDSSSIGPLGERILLFGEHYACGDTIVVRVSDDGTGIGASTSPTPLGAVTVYAATETVPGPDLLDPDELNDGPLQEDVTIVVVNAVESTIQLHIETGNASVTTGEGADSAGDFDVRVPPGLATTGSGACAQEYVISAAHLETVQTTFSQSSGETFASDGSVRYHAAVLHGDGTGTEGFDSNSVAVVGGRLLQFGTHFNCGDTITVMITATNNKLQRDENGDPILDSFGDPTIEYGVGTGSILVTPGG